MALITKIFVEIYVLDIEGRNGKWKTTTMTYEEAVKKINPWLDAVRMIEKTFDPDTFTITTRVLRQTEKVYEKYHWTGQTREVV